MNDYISIISSLIIFIFPYIGRRWFNIQSLSSIAIGLGFLGTFCGIMYGLWVFNVEQIDFSIPILIESIKTALLTSIAGMFSSLLLKISPSFYGIKEKVKQGEITDKQLLELLSNIEKNTRTSTSSELIQTLKQQYEQLENSYQTLNNALLKQTAQETSSKVPYTITPLDNLMPKQLNYPLIKMCDIQEQQLQHISDSQILIQRIQEQLNNIISQLQKSNIKQASSFGEFIKGSEQQMNQQLNRIDEKYEQKLIELEKFTQTLTTIIKKLSQDHDTLYKQTHNKTE